MAVIFKTPGLLDMRAITIFGINAKPNSENPIGFFGTGLKYAIAVLMRHKAAVRIFRGPDEYIFKLKQEDFRGKEFGSIQMIHVNKWIKFRQVKELPFTTELGKTWELWQAFRELESNTRDENGSTISVTARQYFEHDRSKDETVIAVMHAEFDDVYLSRDRIFLPEGLRCGDTQNKSVQTFIAPSRHIYYRGMRVMDLPEPSKVTYNILEKIDLTEDRTAKYTWLVENIIRDYLITTQNKVAIETAITAPDNTFERGIDFAGSSELPSTAFTKATQSLGMQNVNSTAIKHVRTYDPAIREEATKRSWEEKMLEAMGNYEYHIVSSIVFSSEARPKVVEWLENRIQAIEDDKATDEAIANTIDATDTTIVLDEPDRPNHNK